MLDLKDIAEQSMRTIKEHLIVKLVTQGHVKPNSRLIKSMEYRTKVALGVIESHFLMNDYFIYLEKGVKASRIPYGKGGKRGGKSKYINALIKYWKNYRGLSGKDAVRAAFATANKHKQEGMPTKASFMYSKDGTRKGFLSDTLKKVEPIIGKEIEKAIYDDIDVVLESALLKFQQKVA